MPENYENLIDDDDDIEMDGDRDELVYRSCRQGGVRYGEAVAEFGAKFQWDFTDGIYMPATPIWGQLYDSNEVPTIFTHLSSQEIFGNDNPLFVEIGIGNGEFIAHHAKNQSDQNWIGFEVYHKIFEKAVSKAKNATKGRPECNIRLLQFDAELFVRMLPDNSVSGFFVNFPDPWPKAKHKKRRLLKPWFIELMRSKLKHGATITVATDHDDYAMEIAENFPQVNGLESTLGAIYINDIGDYYKTKYYRKFASKGKVYFFNMKRTETAEY